MLQPKIKGMASIVLKRCSSTGQIGTSMVNQASTTEHCVLEHQLRVVEEVLLEGVTGSIPFHRTDIDKIIARKKKLNDFELLVVQDATRFTRAGQGHGQKLIYELRAAGILVYFVAENILVDNEMAEMYISFLFSAAKEAVKRIAYGATIGSTNSYLAGRSPHTRRPPYGLDRMYSEGGEPRHIIRNLADGTQEQLDAKTGELMRRYTCNVRRAVPNHYIKQKSEEIHLVPGDPKHVAVVNLIFHCHDLRHMTAGMIARDLNDAGIPSSRGEEWSTAVVWRLLRSPIYLGRGIRYRQKTGIYYTGGEAQPRASEVDVAELAHRRRPRLRNRKREEWVELPQPHLVNFLPPEVRELAQLRIERYLETVGTREAPAPQKDRHRNSQYLLKGLLRSKQGNHPMTGRQAGKQDHVVRYYGVSRGVAVPKTNNVLRHRVPAEPLEQAIMQVLKATLLSKPDLMAGLKKVVDAQNRQQHRSADGIEQAKLDLKRCRKQLVILSDDVSIDAEDDSLTRKVASLKQNIKLLEQRIREAASSEHQSAVDPAVNIAKLASQLEKFGDEFTPAEVPAIRAMLEVLIRRLEVDLETKEVVIELALPSWMAEAIRSTTKVGLDALSAYKPIIEAHPENGVILAIFHCEIERQRKETCFKCSRKAA
jgi:hypothetical protein